MHSDESTLPESVEEALLRAGFAQGDEGVVLIRSSLNSPVSRQRVLALRAGARRSLVSDEEWLRAMGDEHVEVRREALALLGYLEVRSPNLLEEITAALADPDPLVVDAAAFALGERMHRPAVERLSEVAMRHEDARCREAAVAALGAIGDDRGLPAVLGALADKAPVRRRAIAALANFEGPDVDEGLARAREDRDWQVRAAVSQLDQDEGGVEG
ncbi:MAG TPA: HEAT repeat domain-containing protein [Acidimicrobiales bacterium]|nr:HEAT repeat domain-containing protein [Acidimicrobiales bacterium]